MRTAATRLGHRPRPASVCVHQCGRISSFPCLRVWSHPGFAQLAAPPDLWRSGAVSEAWRLPAHKPAHSLPQKQPPGSSTRVRTKRRASSRQEQQTVAAGSRQRSVTATWEHHSCTVPRRRPRSQQSPTCRGRRMAGSRPARAAGRARRPRRLQLLPSSRGNFGHKISLGLTKSHGAPRRARIRVTSAFKTLLSMFFLPDPLTSPSSPLPSPPKAPKRRLNPPSRAEPHPTWQGGGLGGLFPPSPQLAFSLWFRFELNLERLSWWPPGLRGDGGGSDPESPWIRPLNV